MIYAVMLALAAVVIALMLRNKNTPHMTIMYQKNPGLTHIECGGSVTLNTDKNARKNILTCSRCGATVEFDLIYEKVFGFIAEDGKQRSIPIRRYRDKSVKGIIHLAAKPTPPPSLPYALP